MIITQTPLRVGLVGGGTDLPSYYRQHGGRVLNAAIDKYVYVTVMRPFVPAGIGLEIMDLQAACRTYNILAAEGRKVAAALLFD